MAQDGRIDYSKYTEADLLDALSHIDAARFPLNRANLVDRLTTMRAAKPKPLLTSVVSLSPPESQESSEYRPNAMTLGARLAHIASAVFLLLYGSVGLLLDDIYVPGRTTEGMHFHGYAAVAMFCAILAAIAILISTIVDHYDRRNNERAYRTFAKRSEYAAWTFFVWAALIEIVLNRRP